MRDGFAGWPPMQFCFTKSCNGRESGLVLGQIYIAASFSNRATVPAMSDTFNIGVSPFASVTESRMTSEVQG